MIYLIGIAFTLVFAFGVMNALLNQEKYLEEFYTEYDLDKLKVQRAAVAISLFYAFIMGILWPVGLPFTALLFFTFQCGLKFTKD